MSSKSILPTAFLLLIFATAILSPLANQTGLAKGQRGGNFLTVNWLSAQGPSKNSQPPCTELTEYRQTDLSGTYNGTVSYPGGNMEGTAELVISGNDFTLTAEGGASTRGRITAVTTCRSTRVTMMFEEAIPPPLPTYFMVACVREDRRGMKHFRLTSKDMSSGKRAFVFTQGGDALRGGNDWGYCRSYDR